MNILILGANGAVARLVEEQILTDKAFADERLTLLLRNKNRAMDLLSEQSSIIEGDTNDVASLRDAVENQDIVIDTTGSSKDLKVATNIIQAMEENSVSRLISIVNEQWQVDQSLVKLYQRAGIDYTILRVASLNDKASVDYRVTTEQTNSSAVSRKAVAQIILDIVDDPANLFNQNVNVEQTV